MFKTASCKTKAKAKTNGFKVKAKTGFQDKIQELNFCKNYNTVNQLKKDEDNNSRLDGNLINSRIGTSEIDFLRKFISNVPSLKFTYCIEFTACIQV